MNDINKSTQVMVVGHMTMTMFFDCIHTTDIHPLYTVDTPYTVHPFLTIAK